MGIHLTTIAATLLFAILGGRFARRHRTHQMMWKTCAHRTNTSHQSRFERLQRFWTPKRSVAQPPNVMDIVTFDLTEGRNGSMTIEIPAKSGWSMLQHTHMESDGCSNITTLSGRWFVGSAVWTTPGPAPPEKPGQYTSIGKLDADDDLASARLSGTIASRRLDHLLCSMVQDAEVYFLLCTTPAWIRALYALTRSAPTAREMLVRRVLWVQIRATLHMHDFLEDHGTITIFRSINPWSPPAWVHRFEERVRVLKSKAISGCSYYLGKHVFGMSVRYDEYEPVWAEKGNAQM
ncbi:hypothetical protein BKA63DRAFT_516397 [Paraphoma chrysanthemicola]|nr:hypothetical protein BKA63DRAFT_516397 [Paraphoma chrysanthemicola]